jgi:hypothetical protein
VGRVQIGQVSVRKDVIAIAGLALAGFVLGLLIARMVVGDPRVTTVDYAVLVGNVFERDHDATSAAERLTAIGLARPADSVAAMAEGYAVTGVAAQRDRDSLRELARGLGKPVAETSATAPSGGRLLWVLPLVVLLMFLGLAALFAVKLLGVDFRDAAKWYRGWAGDLASILQRRSWGLHRTTGRVRTANPPARAAVRPRPASAMGAANRPERFPVERRRSESANTQPTKLVFHARYREGDEPYDEVHPIVDAETGRMIGACGLTAGPRMPRDGATTHWGFTAWVQEYPEEGSSPVHAVGLISEWAQAYRTDEIDSWCEADEISEVLIADPGQSVRLGVNLLSVVVTPFEFDFTPAGPPDACFSQLEVRFEVTVPQRYSAPVEERVLTPV